MEKLNYDVPNSPERRAAKLDYSTFRIFAKTATKKYVGGQYPEDVRKFLMSWIQPDTMRYLTHVERLAILVTMESVVETVARDYRDTGNHLSFNNLTSLS